MFAPGHGKKGHRTLGPFQGPFLLREPMVSKVWLSWWSPSPRHEIMPTVWLGVRQSLHLRQSGIGMESYDGDHKLCSKMVPHVSHNCSPLFTFRIKLPKFSNHPIFWAHDFFHNSHLNASGDRWQRLSSALHSPTCSGRCKRMSLAPRSPRSRSHLRIIQWFFKDVWCDQGAVQLGNQKVEKQNCRCCNEAKDCSKQQRILGDKDGWSTQRHAHPSHPRYGHLAVHYYIVYIYICILYCIYI